jgi:hypothetical protein
MSDSSSAWCAAGAGAGAGAAAAAGLGAALGCCWAAAAAAALWPASAAGALSASAGLWWCTGASGAAGAAAFLAGVWSPEASWCATGAAAGSEASTAGAAGSSSAAAEVSTAGALASAASAGHNGEGTCQGGSGVLGRWAPGCYAQVAWAAMYCDTVCYITFHMPWFSCAEPHTRLAPNHSLLLHLRWHWLLRSPVPLVVRARSAPLLVPEKSLAWRPHGAPPCCQRMCGTRYGYVRATAHRAEINAKSV